MPSEILAENMVDEVGGADGVDGGSNCSYGGIGAWVDVARMADIVNMDVAVNKVVWMIGCVDERGRQPRAACPGRQHSPLTRFGDLWVALYFYGCAVTCRLA